MLHPMKGLLTGARMVVAHSISAIVDSEAMHESLLNFLQSHSDQALSIEQEGQAWWIKWSLLTDLGWQQAPNAASALGESLQPTIDNSQVLILT